MELKRSHLVAGGAVLAAVAVAAGLMWFRSTSRGGPVGGSKPVYGADTPEQVIEGVYAACQANDLDRGMLLYFRGPELKDPTLIQKWCQHATHNGDVRAWAIDKTLTKTEPMGGMTMTTATWFDEAKTQKGPYVQWWLMTDGKRWVLTGGL